MKRMEYDLFQGHYINRFVTTGTFAKPQRFKRATLSGKVNEWLDKGFAIHENPCRKEFIAERKGNLPPYVELKGKEEYASDEMFAQSRDPELYFPFGNIGYDASFFYKCPTYIRTYCYVDLEMPLAEETKLEIETCGGVTLWNNGELVVDYIPFTRNLAKRTLVNIGFVQGRNHLVICLDDLAERDTDYYFRLRYMGNQKPKQSLPVPESAEPETIKRYEAILDSLYFTKESYVDEPVSVALPGKYLSETGADQLRMVIMGETETERSASYELRSGMAKLDLISASEVRPGYKNILFCMQSGTIRISRRLGCQIVWKELQARGSERIEDRRKAYLEVLCAYGNDTIYRAAALLKTGRNTERAEKIIIETLKGVNAREDCSDFSFVVILYIYRKFRERLSAAVLTAIEEAAVNYRYWIDEPGDDVMWFFSENHALLFHICQYLAGSFFPDRYFTGSGRNGEQVRRRGEELLNEWFEAFFKESVTEWNSNAYIPIDVHGFGFLYNLTDKDNLFHNMAQRALDMIAYSITVNAHKGVVMTSFGRTYEKELKGNDNSGITALLYILYNEGYLNCGGPGGIALALSDYTAPEEYRTYIGPEGERNLIFLNTQGYERHVNLYLYKNREVVLSTAIQYKPFRKGYQEHIVQAAIDSTAQAFVNHPGEVQPYGSGRPNFWAGNGELPLAVQDRDLSVLVYCISEENRIGFTHAYAPLSEFTAYIVDGDVAVLEKDGAYIGLRARNGLLLSQTGATAYRELVSPGKENVWIVCVGVKKEYARAEDFLARLKAIQITQKKDSVTVIDRERKLELNGDHNYTRNGRAVYPYPLDPKGVLMI